MKLRKCQAIKNNEIIFDGLFHQWGIIEGTTVAIIEDIKGNVNFWIYEVKFMEPEKPRVEVSWGDFTRRGNLEGWFQSSRGEGDSVKYEPVCVVSFDDGVCNIFCPDHLKIINGGDAT